MHEGTALTQTGAIPWELESVFVEIVNPKGKNTIVGNVYRHPCMDQNLFLNDYSLNVKYVRYVPEKREQIGNRTKYMVELLALFTMNST